MENVIPVMILTYKRPLYFEQTLRSFVSRNKKSVERSLFKINVIVQEHDDETQRIIDLYHSYINDVKWLNTNVGCGSGCSKALEWALEYNPDYILYLEDDWFSVDPIRIYLQEIIDYMNANDDVGYIRLRSYTERVSKRNRITKELLTYVQATDNVLVGNSNFTSNPILIKAQVAKNIVPIKSVLDGMMKYNDLGLKVCQLKAGCFYHIGYQRVQDYQGRKIKWRA